MIYVGRIDQNKGCADLFDYFSNYRPRLGQQLSLVLAGASILPIPSHPRIRHLGFVSDRDKFDAIAASEALMMPSRFESLSMVALESWGLGTPGARQRPLRRAARPDHPQPGGALLRQLRRVRRALFTLTSNRALNTAFGENGRRFYERHYAWPVIQRKYEDMLTQLARTNAAPGPLDALPGWLARRRRTLAPAREIVEQFPTGAVSYEEPAVIAGHQSRPPSASPLPRPSPSSGRQAIRRDPRGRGPRPQGQRPDGPRPDRGAQGRQAGPPQNQGPGQAPGNGGNQGSPGQKNQRDRKDARRNQRHSRHRRPPRRNNG